jgi:hypothetical protein
MGLPSSLKGLVGLAPLGHVPRDFGEADELTGGQVVTGTQLSL